MSDHAPSDPPVASREGLMIAALLLIAALCVDLFWLGISPLADGRPAFETPYVVKTALVAGAAWFFVESWAGPAPCALVHPGDATAWRIWGMLSWSTGAGGDDDARSIPVKRLLAWLMALGTLSFVLVARRAPGLVDRVAVEDGLVETLSVVALLLACGGFIHTATRLARRTERNARRLVIIPAGLALLAFVIAMEEVSWLQRLIDLETPGVFAKNDQGELNFHNLVTSEAEYAYYFSGFFLFILLPFILDHGRTLRQHIVTKFAPSRFMLYVTAVIPAYSYEMWNGLPTQIAFFGTVFILLHYGLADRRTGGRGTLEFVLLATVVVTQAGFVSFGHRFDRSWLLTEYKEFLIPLMLLLYAVELATRDLDAAATLPTHPIAANSS